MANANKPSGLTPVRYLNGSDWDGRGNCYYIDSAMATALFVGDPVTLSGGGSANGMPGITIATPGSGLVGAILAIGTVPFGPYIDPTNLTRVSAPATKTQAYYALVADDPNIIFEVQEIGTGTQLDATAIGLNCNLVAGSPATGVNVSGWLLTNTTEATTSTLDVKLLGLSQYNNAGVNTFGAYAKWQVLINNHLFRGGITGV